MYVYSCYQSIIRYVLADNFAHSVILNDKIAFVVYKNVGLDYLGAFYIAFML